MSAGITPRNTDAPDGTRTSANAAMDVLTLAVPVMRDFYCGTFVKSNAAGCGVAERNA